MVFHRLYPESADKKNVLAGLLTCSLLPSLPIPAKPGQWLKNSVKYIELTAAGTVQDFFQNFENHLIPF